MPDLYLLDSNWDAIDIVEGFDTLIWTERYSGASEFQLYVKERDDLSNGLNTYKYLGLEGSNKIMQVESSFSKPQQKKGGNKPEVKGESLEAFFKKRACLTINYPNIGITRTPAASTEWIVDRYLVNPDTARLPGDLLPGLSVHTSNIAGTVEKRLVPRDTIYNMVEGLLLPENLGWQVHKIGSGLVEYSVIKGLDRSTRGTPEYLEFSEDANNLMNTSRLETIKDMKNCVRVIGATQQVDVYADGVSSSISGWNRRSFDLKLPDIGSADDESSTDELNALKQQGRLALRKRANRYVKFVDGDIPPGWEGDYSLGDIVVLKDRLGTRIHARITEVITTIDAKGTRRFPSFDFVRYE